VGIPIRLYEAGCDDGGAALVALAEDLEQQLGAARRQGDVTQLVDDEELVASELALKAKEMLLVPGLEQLMALTRPWCRRE
jgi:hypothetical protein